MKHQFDIALSFATENQALVEDVYQYLKAEGYRVFFAPSPEGQAFISGKNQRQVFYQIFGWEASNKSGVIAMDQKKEDMDLDFIKIQYQALSSRQINHSTLVWNAVTTLFVAQAFLWNIALDEKINIIIRCFVSLISTLTSFASFQNFVRHRWVEIADCEQLEAIEQLMLKEQNCPVMIVHQQLSKRTLMPPKSQIGNNLEDFLKKNQPDYKKSFIDKWKTFKIWRFVLGVVMLFTACLFGYNVYLAISLLGLAQR